MTEDRASLRTIDKAECEASASFSGTNRPFRRLMMEIAIRRAIAAE